MGLEADDSHRPDERVMLDARREIEAVPDCEIDLLPLPGQPEPDRAPLDDEHLVVAMRMHAVPVAGTVRPGRRGKALDTEAARQVAIGIAAAVVTYGVGSLVGFTVH